MVKYEKTAWVDGETVLKADHMKKIEKGIVDLCTEIENITSEEIANISNKISEVDELIHQLTNNRTIDGGEL